ncbi:hypothetical protein HOD08_03015, partial [bacterium]|nr:hypothetical protein [bacterium]
MRYSLVLVGCLVAHLAIATFEFESKDSTLKISSTASLYLDNSTLMSGTLQKVSSSSEISLGGNSATYGPGYIVAGASATATVGDFNLSSSGELERNSDIEASDKITVSDDMTLDGKGGRISFSNPDTAQLVVNSNKTLTLQNITLSRIGTNTISLAETAKIVIGSNVSFELIDDVTLTQGVIELSGTAVVFKIKGLGGRKHFKLEPDVYHQTDKLLRLGAHTVLLDAIEFSGIRYMTATTTSRTVVGDITLAGTTILNIDYAAITISITAQSRDNVIKISKNNVNLDCFFFFGTAEENEVHFQFSGISGIPAIRFGTNFMALSTTAGRAKLMFDDPEVNIYNKGAESFTIGSNAYFDGHKITIQNYPIKQTAANFDSSSNLELESVLTNAISRIVTRAPFDHSLMNRPTTAFLIKQREQFGDAPFQKEIPKPDGKKKDGVHGNRPAGVTPRPRVPRRAPEDLSFEDIEGVYYDLCDFELPEGAFKTIAATATSEYQYAMKMGSASGLISLKKTGKLTGFGINASDQLLLTMNNGSKIEQSTTAATFKSNDTLTVNGTGNIIDVSANMTLSGTLSLQASSDLTFNFKDVATPPVLTIGSSSGVSLPAGSTLIFNGKGTVKILDGVDFTFVETSVLEMSDSAKLTLDTSATSTFSGKGTIKLSDGGLLALESAGHLTLGTATTDELNIKAV